MKKTRTAKKKKPAAKAAPLLQKGEPRPFRVVNPKGKGPFRGVVGVICVDHASNRVPKALQKTLGVKKSGLARHIGWDIGAEDAALHLAKKLDMPAIVAAYSRLVVDLNRDPGNPESMPTVSDHTPVPGNKNLSAAARKRRLDTLFWPYQDAIGEKIDAALKKGQVPILLSIHSFTPRMDGFRRPWHIGLLWNKDRKSAQTFIKTLRKKYPRYKVGDNEPYTLRDKRFKGHTVWRHAEQKGIPHILVEFRQDLIDTPEKAQKWADIFIEALMPVLKDKATFRRRKVK